MMAFNARLTLNMIDGFQFEHRILNVEFCVIFSKDALANTSDLYDNISLECDPF